VAKVDLRTLPKHQQTALSCLEAADNLTGRIDYTYFVQNILGHDFWQIRDPRVQQHLNRIDAIFRSWALHRKDQKTFRKVMDIRPRSTCKSATVTIPLIPYAHLHDPEIAGAIMSASYEKMALKFSNATRQIWEGDDPLSRLTEVYGAFKPTSTRQRQWRDDKMVTQKRRNLAHADPTLAAYSIAQGPTSGHFDIFLLDDPITEEMMERDMRWLDKVWGAYNRLPAVINRDGLLYLIMTRYRDNDIVGRIIEEEIEPKVRDADLEGAPSGKLPADFNKERGWIPYAHMAGWEVFYDSVYEDYDRKSRTGRLVYPTIWTEAMIESLRQSKSGEGVFWSQLMNQPARREDAPITQDMIDRCWLPNLQAVPARAFKTIDIHCDFAFKDADNYRFQSGDWGVAHVVAKDGGYVYRINGYRGKDTQKKFGEQLIKLVSWVYMTYGTRVRYVTYEQSAGHGSGEESTRMWLHNLMMSYPDLPRFTPYPIKRLAGPTASRGKMQRIMNQNWAWQEGYVILIEEAPFNDALVDQILNQGYTQHDDDIDAFADAFHEQLYKKVTRNDLPGDVTQFTPGADNWCPHPKVFGAHDPLTGQFHPERRNARSSPKMRNTLSRAAYGVQK